MNKGLGTEKSIWILEDDEDDFFLTKKALVDAGFNGEVHWFKDTKIIGDGLKTDFQKLQTELTTPLLHPGGLKHAGNLGIRLSRPFQGKPLFKADT
jgi:hypothetical protein